MTKNRLILLVAVVAAASLFVGAVAAEVVTKINAEIRRDFTVMVDGEEQVFKNAGGERVYPIVHDGTTYLPVRAIGELMGKTVYWYEGDKRIELKDEKTTVTDADVIVTEKDNKTDKTEKPEKNVKPNEKADSPKGKKPEKAVVDENKLIGVERAKEIALKKAGLKADDVSFRRVELDKDNRVQKYEVEFRKGNVEYEADIKADDGTILDWDVDLDD